MKICSKCLIEKPLEYFHKQKICRDGHRPDCKICVLKYQSIKRYENPNKYKEWVKNNPEKSKKSSNSWKDRNRDRTRELSRQSAIRWKKNNPGKSRAHEIRREQNIKRAIPKWADLKKISKFYEDASRITKETGILHHVDHIVPINSKFVCGLHCENNLQIIPAFDNISKGNRWWPDMPESLKNAK